MKRYLTAVLALLLLVSVMPLTAFGAEKEGFSTRIRVTSGSAVWNTKKDGSGERYETVIVEYQLKGSGIKGIQGTWFAVDMSRLLLVDFSADGDSVLDLIRDGGLVPGYVLTRWNDAGMCALKKPVISDEDENIGDRWSFSTINSTVMALDAASDTLFLCPQPMQSYSVTYEAYTTVVSFRFAVLPGAQLSENSVRLISQAERDSLHQSFISAMNDGLSGYYFGSKSAADTLATPIVFWNVFTDTETDLPPVTDIPEEKDAPNGAAGNHPFTDIPADARYQEAIAYVYHKGLFRGMSAATFAPDAAMTRAMFVTVLGRLAGVHPTQYPGKSFNDVEENTWYAPYVRWASEAEIVLGYGDGTFGVEDALTIEQAVVIMARYARYVGMDVLEETWEYRYFDADVVSAWAISSMRWATKNGLYVGNNGWLMPQSSAKRSLLAEILYAYDAID